MVISSNSILTLNMLNCFKDYKSCIHIPYHDFDKQKIKFTMKPYKLLILYCQYHACWCPVDLSRQGISRHGIYQVSQASEVNCIIKTKKYKRVIEIIYFPISKPQKRVIYRTMIHWRRPLVWHEAIRLRILTDTGCDQGDRAAHALTSRDDGTGCLNVWEDMVIYILRYITASIILHWMCAMNIRPINW